MRIAPGLRRVSRRARSIAALAIVAPLLAACTVSGPATLGETGALTGAKPAAPAAAPSTAAAPAAAPAAGLSGTAQSAPVKVVLLLPLSGAPHVAAIAKGMKQAGELALFELDNPAVQLVVKDDKGTAEGARVAAEEAVREGAELILGPLLSGSVAGAAPAARGAGVPVVAFSNDPQVAGSGVYLLSFLVRQEIERVVAHAAGQSRKRFAALFPAGAHGQSLEDAFATAVARHGGTLVAKEAVAADATGIGEPLQRLVEAVKAAEAAGAPVEALFIPGGHDAVAAAAPLLAANGLDPERIKLVGTGGWDLPGGAREAPLAGAWYAGPDPRGWREFAERFVKTYGVPPPRLATLAYDGVAVAVALSSGAPRARYTAASLTRANGFAGIDGQFRLLPGGLAERALAVLELQKFGVGVIDPAPGAPGSARLTSAAKPD